MSPTSLGERFWWRKKPVVLPERYIEPRKLFIKDIVRYNVCAGVERSMLKWPPSKNTEERLYVMVRIIRWKLDNDNLELCGAL